MDSPYFACVSTQRESHFLQHRYCGVRASADIRIQDGLLAFRRPVVYTCSTSLTCREESTHCALAGVVTQEMVLWKVTHEFAKSPFHATVAAGRKRVHRLKHALETPARFSDCFGRFVANKQVRKCIPV
jgi:hypothetical protein